MSRPRTLPGNRIPYNRDHASPQQIADAIHRHLIRSGRRYFKWRDAEEWAKAELPNYQRPEYGRALKLLRNAGMVVFHRSPGVWEYFPGPHG